MKKIILFIFSIIISLPTFSQNMAWAKQIGGTGSDYGNAVTTDAVGCAYITGEFTGTVDFDPGAGIFNMTAGGPSDIFISKLDGTGNFIWAKQISQAGAGSEVGYAITIDPNGDVCASGYFNSIVDFDPGPGVFNLSSLTGGAIYILKLDSAGNFIWAKAVYASGNSYGTSIRSDNSGNLFLTGRFIGMGDFDPGPAVYNIQGLGSQNNFVMKLTSAGDFVWAKGITSSTSNSVGLSLALDAQCNVYTTGWFGGTLDFDPDTSAFNLTSFGSDIFVLKLDSAGNFRWAKHIGANADDFGRSIAVDAPGNVYTTGYFRGTADFDPGPATFNLTNPASGYKDMFISKLDSSGNFVLAGRIGGNYEDEGLSVTTDSLGNFYYTGTFLGTVDFDIGPNVNNLTAQGAAGTFVLKMDVFDNFVWARRIDGSNTASGTGNSIALDNSENIFVSGTFTYTMDFDPSAAVFNLTSNGIRDVFVFKMGQILTDNMEKDFIYNDYIFPNPATSELVVRSSEFGDIEGIEIYSSLGEKIFSQISSLKSQISIDISQLPPGIYFITVTDQAGNKVTKKVVKM